MDCIYNIAEQRKCESSVSRSEWKCDQVHLSSVNSTQAQPLAHSDCKAHKHKSSLTSVAVADFSCHDLFSWLVLHIAFSSLPFVILVPLQNTLKTVWVEINFLYINKQDSAEISDEWLNHYDCSEFI